MRIESTKRTGIAPGAVLDATDHVPPTELPATTQPAEPETPSSEPAAVTGDPMAKTLAQVSFSGAAQPSRSSEVDPRFAAINEALQAGNADEAMAAARQLLAALQK
jgi:hypothetical protein